MAVSGILVKKTGRKEFYIVGAVVFILFYFNYVSIAALFNSQQRCTPGTLITVTSIRSLINGTFPTALDKQGTNGVCVKIYNVRVLGVTHELDQDYHVDITDERTAALVTEFTPGVNQTLPAVNSTISITGVYYCDTAHQNEAWHGFTCAEIHPVIRWALYNSSLYSLYGTPVSGNFTFSGEPGAEP